MSRLLIDLDIVIYSTLCAVNDQSFFAQIRACKGSLEKIIKDAGAHESKLFLTGVGNFRYGVSSDYKQNRKDIERPKFLDHVKRYFVRHHKAILSNGVEADDLIVSEFKPGDIIVSIDKDFKQVTGAIIYNWKRETFVTIENGWEFFCEQLLAGDAADNISALPNPAKKHHKNSPKFTAKTAQEILDGKTTEEMKEIVVQLYKDEYGENWFDQFEKAAGCLWLRRSETDDYSDWW